MFLKICGNQLGNSLPKSDLVKWIKPLDHWMMLEWSRDDVLQVWPFHQVCLHLKRALGVSLFNPFKEKDAQPTYEENDFRMQSQKPFSWQTNGYKEFSSSPIKVYSFIIYSFKCKYWKFKSMENFMNNLFSLIKGSENLNDFFLCCLKLLCRWKEA